MKRALQRTTTAIAITLGFVFGLTSAGTPAAAADPHVVDVAVSPTGNGWWTVRSDGLVAAFGDATLLGRPSRLNRPIVGIASSPTGRGYWLVAEDGGIFTFGDARFFGSTGAMRLNRTVIGMASTATGRGYWLLSDDGGIFSFGDARYAGSTGALRLNSPIVDMAPTSSGKGYWLVGADGGLFTFGDAPFLGAGTELRQPVVGLGVVRPSGYRIVAASGQSIERTTEERAPSAPQTAASSAALPFPGPGTVGHLANLPGHNVPASSLRPHVGSYETTRDGEVVEGLSIPGMVVVKHRDVVIRRNRIGLGVSAIPTPTHPSVSARVEWNTIGPEGGFEEWHLSGNGRGENLVFYRNEIFGGVDLFNFYDRGNVVVQENWAYGPYQMLDDRFQQDQPTTVSHSDGVQVHMGGRRYHFVRNRFDLFLFRGYRWAGAPNASAQVPILPAPTARSQLGVIPNVAPVTTGFLFQQTNGRVDDILFDGNRVDGDFYRALSFEKGPFDESATNVRIVNNTFVRRYPTFGRNQLVGADTPANIVFDGNIDEAGSAIPRPSGMRAAG